MTNSDPHTWADGYGRWHAAVTPGNDASRRARAAIRAELIARGMRPEDGYLVLVERSPDDTRAGRVVYRERFEER